MRRILHPLTSLRFFAAALVVVHHFIPAYAPEIYKIGLVQALVGEGFLGVSLFFVLSGFVLAYTYAHSLRVPSVVGWRDFFVARFARVYPLYLLTFGFAVAVVPMRPGSTGILVGHLFLLQAFVPAQEWYFAFNAPAWSVSAEAFFYACFPGLLALLSVARLTAPRPATFCAAGFALLWLTLCWFLTGGTRSHWWCYILPVTRFFDFLVGVFCGVAFVNSHTARRTTRLVGTLWELAALFLLMAMVAASPWVPYELRLGAYYTVPMAAIVVVFARGDGLLSEGLRWWPLLVLGEASYSLYLLHYPFMIAVGQMMTKFGLTTLPLPVIGFIVLGGALSLSVALHYVFEKPTRNGLRWLLSSRRPKRSEPSVEMLARKAA